MTLEIILALVAFCAIACIASYLIGQRAESSRRELMELDIRAIWENRYRVMILNGSSERELYRLAADAERAIYRVEVEKLLLKNQMVLDQAAHERELLLTRIQAWSPGPVPVPPAEKPASLPSEQSEEGQEFAELDKLRAEQIDATLDGQAFIDLKNGASFESPEEIREWRRYCKQNALPETTDPRTYVTGG